MPSSLLGLPPSTIVLAAMALFAGGFARGYSGFGMTAILMPVLAFVMPTAEIVPTALALEVLASAGQARSALRKSTQARAPSPSESHAICPAGNSEPHISHRISRRTGEASASSESILSR